MDVITVFVSLLVTALIVGAGYWWYKRNKPKNTFIGVDFGAGSAQPRNIRNLFGPFKVKLKDGRRVSFPVPQGYGIARQDGKGTLFFGDINTGQLFKPRREGNGVVMDFVHGIFNELALADGRVEQVVRHTRGGTGLTLQHIAMLVGICIILLIVVIYQYARAGGVAG